MPSTSPATISILRATQQCIQFFRRGLPRARRGLSSPLDLDSQASLENQLGRFKIWAGNIGVFAAGNASTDYRLRQDQDVKDVMIQMLARLKKHLEQLISLSSLPEERTQEDSSSDSVNSSTSSSPSLVLSLGSESEPSTASTSEAQERRQPSHDRLKAIDEVITRLYGLSAIIRKPMSFDEVAKVKNFIRKNQDPQDMEEFESHIRWQTQFRHPEASATLIDRLVSTVVFRRHKLLYRERHHGKLNQGVDQAFGLEIEIPDISYAPKVSQNYLIKKSYGKSRFLTSPATVKSSSQTIPYSATEASMVNRFGFSPYSKSVALSGMTKSAVARREHLDVPPPPRVDAEAEETVCPYCFEVVDKEKMKHALWTRHVLKDIYPYICLFEDCNKPNEHFRNVEDWLNHMKWQHTIVWSCQAAGHKSIIFDSQVQFEQHMKEEHHDTFTESQLPMLVQKSAHPATDTFSVLTARNNDAASGSHYECPLCSFFVEKANDQNNPDSALLGAEFPINEAAKNIQNHIAAHLESIALLSLPEQDAVDDDFSIARESETTKKNSTRQDNDQDSLSSKWSQEEQQQQQQQQHSPILDPDEHHEISPSEIVPESFPETTEKLWAHIFNTLGLRQTDHFELTQDATLRGFVERARNIQMISSWKNSQVPVLIVFDPDGIEIAIYDPKVIDEADQAFFVF